MQVLESYYPPHHPTGPKKKKKKKERKKVLIPDTHHCIIWPVTMVLGTEYAIIVLLQKLHERQRGWCGE